MSGILKPGEDFDPQAVKELADQLIADVTNTKECSCGGGGICTCGSDGCDHDDTTETALQPLDEPVNSIFINAIKKGAVENVCVNECGTGACIARCTANLPDAVFNPSNFDDVCEYNKVKGMSVSADDGVVDLDTVMWLAHEIRLKYTALQKMGVNADDVMKIVHESKMSWFIDNDSDMMSTIMHYQKLGVATIPKGEYPTSYVVSIDEQTDANGVEYAKHEILKGVNYYSPEEKITELIKKTVDIC